MLRFVTTADTEILATAGAVGGLPGDFPAVRCANPGGHPDPGWCPRRQRAVRPQRRAHRHQRPGAPPVARETERGRMTSAVDSADTPTGPSGGSDRGTESQVKHMKWWGWGVDGVSFRHDDKPKFAAFVRQVIDLDVTTPGKPMLTFDELPVPAPKIDSRS